MPKSVNVVGEWTDKDGPVYLRTTCLPRDIPMEILKWMRSVDPLTWFEDGTIKISYSLNPPPKESPPEATKAKT